MKKGIVAIIVKTPGFSPLKTRLAKSIGKDRAEEFYRLSVRSTEGYITRALQLVPGLTATWAVAEVEGAEDSIWHAFATTVLSPGDLGHRLGRAYAYFLETYDYVLFVGADSPHVSGERLHEAVAGLANHSFSVGRTTDGGFYIFGGKVPVPLEKWTSVLYSQPDTAQQLEKTFASLGTFAEVKTEFDIDTVEDLATLRDELLSRRKEPSLGGEALGPTDEKLLQFIEELPSFPKAE
jgi:glycosyltransferase A (GT-A) superfamily protein (DUF2064 family)